MIARQFDPVAELQSAFSVLMKNYSIAAIPLVALIVCFTLFGTVLVVAGGTALLSGGFTDLSSNPMALVQVITASLAWFGLVGLVAFIISMVANGAAVAASESAWQSGTADVGGGFSRALAKLGDLVVLAIALGFMCIVIGWTGIGLIAIGFLMLYTLPAVIVGGESAFQAIGTSWNMATKNAGPTFAAFIGIILVYFVGLIVNMIIGHIPILGWIAQLVINALLSVYVSLVTVRFYDLLRGSGLPMASATLAPPPPPPTPVS
jgi:hypothetical protein